MAQKVYATNLSATEPLSIPVKLFGGRKLSIGLGPSQEVELTKFMTTEEVGLNNEIAYAKAQNLISMRREGESDESLALVARLIATSNRALTGLAAIDSVTPVAGDIILIQNNSTTTQNGLYIAASGAWSRLKRGSGEDIFSLGLQVFVNEGTTHHDTLWTLTNNTVPVVGTDTPTFAESPTDMSLRAELAAVTAGAGAALVGTEDPNALLDGATVESGLLGLARNVIVIETTVTKDEVATPGKVLFPTASVPAGKKFYIDSFLIKVNGAAAWVDGAVASLLIQDLNGAPVVFLTVAKAGLGANEYIITPADGDITIGAGFWTGGTAAKGLCIVSNTGAVFGAGDTLIVRITGHLA